MHTKTISNAHYSMPHINMNIDSLRGKLDVYIQLRILKEMPVQTTHHSCSRALDDIALYLLDHIYSHVAPK